ncbi:MAG: hypothetical protein M0R21_06740 [Lentimicrobiaceae bacterium]|jgi:hypothetical protein|nr:hypothetical protein [Lentimicrobiaceae bacterium]
MKKAIKTLLVTGFILTAPLFLSTAFGQPHPNNGAVGGGNGGPGAAGPIGGGAPMGSGVIMLLAMAAGYGYKKIYDIRKK